MILRSLLLVVAVLALGAAFQKAGTGTSFKGPVGLQLYSLRADFPKDVPGTLGRVKAMGFSVVELAGTYGMTAAAFKGELDKAGLKASSMHTSFESLRDKIDSVISDAKTLGVEYVGCAWIPHQGDDFTEADTTNAIQVFNAAGAKLKAAGLKFFYHTHGYEFRPHGAGTLFDLFMSKTDPSVLIEMDVFWVVHPGQDPVKLFEKYGKRIHLMHLKDMKPGLKGDLTGRAPENSDVVLGTGQVEWPRVLAAAKKAGVKYYFVEDESTTAGDQIPKTLKYLESVKF
jgi:sugar phosphate isomerase/epimerase